MSAADVSMQDLLAGAQPLGDVHHRQLRGLAQHRHHHVVVAQVLGDRDDPLDQRLAADPTARHRVKAPTIRVVSRAARIERVSGQRRYTVGLLTRARRAISANVTRSTP